MLAVHGLHHRFLRLSDVYNNNNNDNNVAFHMFVKRQV